MSQKYFITGASGGLGIELVKTVLNAGNTVVAAVRRPEALADLAAQSGGRLIAEKLDVTQIGEIAAVAARHQDTDVLINNAGGAIVYITSVGGRVSFPGGALYHAAKFGLEGFAETVAQEVAGFGINTLIVEPGSMKTDFITNVNWTEESEAYRDSTVGQVRRYIEQYGEDNIAGDPQKIAAVIYNLTQLPAPPLRTALGVDTFATLEQAYANNVATLAAQKVLAESVAFAGKTGFRPTQE